MIDTIDELVGTFPYLRPCLTAYYVGIVALLEASVPVELQFAR